MALALELTCVEMPNLICIDEPTSGLDSNSSELVLQCLSTLARTLPLTIVASIHQPSHRALNMFHEVHVLARGGVCVYQGRPSGIKDHLARIPVELEPKGCDHQFPLEELVKVDEVSGFQEDRFQTSLFLHPFGSNRATPFFIRSSSVSFNKPLTLSKRTSSKVDDCNEKLNHHSMVSRRIVDVSRSTIRSYSVVVRWHLSWGVSGYSYSPSS